MVQKSEHDRLPELTFWGQENQIHEEVSMMSGSNESLEEYRGELEETDKVGAVRALRKDAGKSKGKIPETRMCFREKKECVLGTARQSVWLGRVRERRERR